MISRKPSLTDNIDDFINGAKDEKTSVKQEKQKPIQQEETDPQKLRRQTYYITELYIQAIEQMAFFEKMDKSEIVREALKQYVPKKYIGLAIRE